MSYRTSPLYLLVMVFMAFRLPSFADDFAKSRPATLNDMSMEVTALQTLHQFQFTSAQMQTLRKLAKVTCQEAVARSAPKASEKYQHTLADLRKALVEANDSDRIDQLWDELESLQDGENPQLDDSVEITDAARRHAKEVLRLLSAGQVVAYLANYGEDFPDPHQRLLDALDEVRGLDAKQWQQLRDDVSEEVARLTAGLDTDKAEQISDQVVQLLIQVRALKDDEFKRERPELEEKARKIVGKMDPLTVIRHVVEQALAELLSNPRLAAAIDARLKK